MATTRLSFSYPQEQKDALLKLAETDGRKLSNYVQKVLGDHITKHAEPAEPAEPKKKKKKRVRK